MLIVTRQQAGRPRSSGSTPGKWQSKHLGWLRSLSSHPLHAYREQCGRGVELTSQTTSCRGHELSAATHTLPQASMADTGTITYSSNAAHFTRSNVLVQHGFHVGLYFEIKVSYWYTKCVLGGTAGAWLFVELQMLATRVQWITNSRIRWYVLHTQHCQPYGFLQQRPAACTHVHIKSFTIDYFFFKSDSFLCEN